MAGKAQSRLNAFRHGLAGQGDILGPGEDDALVAARTAAFVAEFQAAGVAGEFLARRAAILSVRMDRAENDEAVGLKIQVQAARAAYETARVEETDRLADLLTRELAMHAARVELEQSPEGIDRLILFWERERQWLSTAPAQPSRIERLGNLLAGTSFEPIDWTLAELGARIDAECARLRQVDEVTRAGRLAAIERERATVERAARLDPSPQVIQIRRYDAAAERGFFRSVRTIGDLRRDSLPTPEPDKSAEPAPVAPSTPTPTNQVTPEPVPAPPAAAPAPTLSPVGSFRLGAGNATPTPVAMAGATASPVAEARSRPGSRRDRRRRSKSRR